MANQDFLENMLKEQEKREMKQVRENTLILDIETGSNEIEKWTEINTANKIQELLNSKYQWRSNWGEKANLEHQEKFEADKADKISKIVAEGSEISALDVWLNRICIVGYKLDGKLIQLHEAKMNEQQMLSRFVSDASGKTIVTANGKTFDMICIQIHCAKYGIHLGAVNRHIDILDAFGKVWGFKKEVASLDKLSVALGIEPNKYQDVNPAEIGSIFRNYSSGINRTEESVNEIKKILAYNAEDIRQTEECYYKLNAVGLI